MRTSARTSLGCAGWNTEECWPLLRAAGDQRRPLDGTRPLRPGQPHADPAERRPAPKQSRQGGPFASRDPAARLLLAVDVDVGRVGEPSDTGL